MTKQRLVPLSKLMSLILRHEPKTFGLTLDAEGFASLEELLMAIRTRLPETNAADIVAVVETIELDKRRFSIVDDEIRANYGHSLAERIAQQRAEPPALLLHGTTETAASRILVEGLSPMRRQYVHMTVSPALAAKVGSRHGRSLLLEIDACAAHEAGVAFYRANENFWLAEAVPARFLRRKP